MLMSCLRYLALCPCPRCLLLKSKISLIGLKTDIKMRLILVRKDSEDRREKVEQARTLMFDKGIAITSVMIERILQPQSLTPTRVSATLCRIDFNLELLVPRMHSQSDFSTTASTSMNCLYLICFTNSSSEYLKRSLFI
jgi:hypothetical protein